MTESDAELVRCLRICFGCSGTEKIIDPNASVTFPPSGVMPPLPYVSCPYCRLNRAAADRIEALATENGRLRKSLRTARRMLEESACPYNHSDIEFDEWHEKRDAFLARTKTSD